MTVRASAFRIQPSSRFSLELRERSGEGQTRLSQRSLYVVARFRECESSFIAGLLADGRVARLEEIAPRNMQLPPLQKPQ